MCDGNARVRRSRDAGGNPGHNLELDRSIIQPLRLFASASEHERIATFEAHHSLSIPGQPYQQLVDLVLSNRIPLAASLPDVIQLGSSRLPRARRKQRHVGKRIIDNGVGRFDELLPADGEQSRIARASAHQKHLALRHGYALAWVSSPTLRA